MAPGADKILNSSLSFFGHAAAGRKGTTYKLRLLLGITFAKGAFWYSNPDVDRFFASFLHIASGGRVSTNANIDGLFVRRTNGRFEVCHTTLLRLGCTTQQLFEMLRRMPGAAMKHRHCNAAPLFVPAPHEAACEQLPVHVSPLVFNVETPPPLCLSDELSSERSSSSTKTLDIGGVLDIDLLEDGMYAESAATAAIEVESDLDDIAGELLTVELELGAVANRIQALLNQHCDALGGAPGAGVLLTGSLERLLEQVCCHRVAAEDKRDESLACDFSSLF